MSGTQSEEMVGCNTNNTKLIKVSIIKFIKSNIKTLINYEPHFSKIENCEDIKAALTHLMSLKDVIY